MNDNTKKWSERKTAQSKFKSLNSYLNSQRTDRDKVETDERVNADISYFPFTHGEVIEKQRKEHTETQKQELQTIFNQMLAQKEKDKQDLRDKAKRADATQNLLVKQIAEESRYIELLEEQRIQNRAEEATQGGDATVEHINQSKVLAPRLVKQPNPYRKPERPGPYQLAMEEAILRREYDL